MKEYDVVIVGAGLAGLQCAKLLGARAGASVLLVDRKNALDEMVHTTGIFVRRTLEDFALPQDCLGPVVRHVSLYSPQRRVLNLESKRDEFRIGRMGQLYKRFLQDCVSAGVVWSPSTKYTACEPNGESSIVKLETSNKAWSVKARVIVGSDGAQSRIGRDLGLDQNSEWIVGVEEVFQGAPLNGEPRFHCFLDTKFAPGYLAWIVNDGEETHIGVGGYAERFEPMKALVQFRQSVENSIVDLSRATRVEKRGGRIPVGGALKRIANERGLLIGDAAGAVSPLTAGGLDPCLRLSRLAALVIEERLKTNDAQVLKAYSGEMFRARFASRLWMRRAIAAIGNQTLMEMACAFLRLPLGRKFASQVFFGRGSFPDVELDLPNKAERLRALGV
jgi:flavin-dependent dehydrogenase